MTVKVESRFRGSSLKLQFADGLERIVDRCALPRAAGPGDDPIRTLIEEARIEGDELLFRDACGELAVPLAQLRSDPVRIFYNLRLAKPGHRGIEHHEGLAIVTRGDTIDWVGQESELSAELSAQAKERRDLEGRVVSSGFVDSHAHPIFAGSRANEFAMRARGAGYLDIAKAGGGILSTVASTRAASDKDLIRETCRRLWRALSFGTTTMEAKTGYALSPDGELRLLELLHVISGLTPMQLEPTLLAAHALPAGFEGARHEHLQDLADQLLTPAAKLYGKVPVDIYCDEGAFTLAESEVLWRKARSLGMPVKGHLGQFADLGGPELMASLGGLSADHLEAVSESGMAAMAKAGVSAVLLPGACVQLKMNPPPIEALRSHGVSMALGSDLNPGTSHSENLQLVLWLATTHYRMSVEEALHGVGSSAACALGLADRGLIAPGMRGDFCVWNVEEISELAYHFGVSHLHQSFVGGVLAYSEASGSMTSDTQS